MPTASYLLLPWFATCGGSSPIGQGDAVYLYQIFLPADITVSFIAMMAAQAVAGDHWATGLYDLDGNLVLESGPIVMAGSGSDELLSASISPVDIVEGVYWLAWTSDSITSTIRPAQTFTSAQYLLNLGTLIFALAAGSSDEIAPYVKIQA